MWANEPEMAEKWANEEDEIEEGIVRITKRQLRRMIREVFDYPEGYELTNVDKVYEIIQPLLDASNIGLDRQGEIAMEIADVYASELGIPEEAGSSFLKNEIYAHAEDILKTDEGYHDEDEEEEQRYAQGRPWEHN